MVLRTGSHKTRDGRLPQRGDLECNLLEWWAYRYSLAWTVRGMSMQMHHESRKKPKVWDWLFWKSRIRAAGGKELVAKAWQRLIRYSHRNLSRFSEYWVNQFRVSSVGSTAQVSDAAAFTLLCSHFWSERHRLPKWAT